MLCLKHCTVWLRDLNTKKIVAEVFEELRNVALEGNEKDKIEKITNELLEHIALLNNFLCRKLNWIGDFLRRNVLFNDAADEQKTEVHRVGRRS